MITPLVSYTLRKHRLKKNMTIDEVSNIIGVDKTYLSKLENNKLVPNERKLKQLYHLYGIKSYLLDYLDFNEKTVKFYLNKIYYIQIDENDISNLNEMIFRHQFSIYLGHLELIKWCYKSLNFLWDDEFLIQLKIFVNLLDLLSIEERTFFLLCLMFYYVRNKEFNKYNQCKKKLEKIENRKWLGLQYYIELSYDYNTNNYGNMYHHINDAKKALTFDKNFKRFNVVLQYEGIFYNMIGDYKNEMKVYSELEELYKEHNQLLNYGVTKQNIASLLLIEKKYEEAIPYYLEGFKYNSLNGPCFELAWCYYNIGDLVSCKKAIKMGQTAKTQLTYYNDLFEWLLKMINNPYSKSCLNLLLKLEKQYYSNLNKEEKNFLMIAIANNYVHLGEVELASNYYKRLIKENVLTGIEMV